MLDADVGIEDLPHMLSRLPGIETNMVSARVDGIHQPFCSHLDRAFKLVTFNVSLLDVMLCLHT